jgi:RNA polymerase sigma factor (sigma-70 family)
MTDDAELLLRYANERSEAAFSELVHRHVDLVYSSALRQMQGDHHRAQEVTQMVFIDLARKAAALVRHPVLPAWLHRSSHLASLNLRRREARRRAYEKKAGTETTIIGSGEASVDWKAVGPVLDAAINELEERDRQAILLRFFAGNPFGEVGRRLKLSENAARMRVERALEKLHSRLARRGITSSSAALAAALTAQSVAAAPVSVAGAASAAALTMGGGAAGVWLTLMATSKLPIALTAAALVGGSLLVGVQENALAADTAALAHLRDADAALPALARQNRQLALSALHDRSLLDDASGIPALERQVAALEAAGQTRIKGSSGSSLDSAAIGDPPLFDYTKLDVRPKVLKQGRPAPIPNLAGEVLVDFIIGPDGSVHDAAAVASSNRAFEGPAIDAVSQWVFSPGQVGGQNVAVHMRVPIVFSPSSEAPPPTVTWF